MSFFISDAGFVLPSIPNRLKLIDEIIEEFKTSEKIL
jgi:hypothetical protein